METLWVLEWRHRLLMGRAHFPPAALKMAGCWFNRMSECLWWRVLVLTFSTEQVTSYKARTEPFKIFPGGSSLVVQWDKDLVLPLQLWYKPQRDVGLIPGPREFPHAIGTSKKKNLSWSLTNGFEHAYINGCINIFLWPFQSLLIRKALWKQCFYLYLKFVHTH